MKNNNQITVSVRLCEGEYHLLQEAARNEYTTMSGILRRLINRHIKGDGKQWENTQTI